MSARVRTISELQGRRILSGVWMETLDTEQQAEMYNQNESWIDGDAESWLILLDGMLLRITEDPNDGYRSMSRDIIEVNNVMPVNWWGVSEVVECHYVTRWVGAWYVCDEEYELGKWWLDDWEPPESLADRGRDCCQVLALISEETQKPVCIFGTNNSEDYYPMFVAKFYPQNMAVNGDLVDITGRKDL